jgi:AraC family transcriptional regulator
MDWARWRSGTSEVDPMFANSPRSSVSTPAALHRNSPNPLRAAVVFSLDGLAGERHDAAWRSRRDRAVPAPHHTVDISPPDIVKRRSLRWDGMAVELVQATARDRIAFRFRAPQHLLIVSDQGVRSDGDTFVEGLPPSRLRDVRRKLTFVPAGHDYHEWQEPRVLARVMYCYFDPAKMPTLPEVGLAPTLTPRLFFEDATLWNTALKLKRLMEGPGSESSPYIKALGIVLAHELVRFNGGSPRVDAPIRGGLAAWQQRSVTDYIEEHLADPIPLATLAQLARLSPYYFCRAFKQSFGVPPHRFHNNRRIEHAKAMLAKPDASVTEIGMTVGFSETSSFTAAFHKTTGLTPTAFRRALT